MSERISKTLTPYPDINGFISDFAEGLKNLLSGDLIGLYLGGSLSYGDFVAERSDIDLQAVVSTPLTVDELTLLEQLHQGIEQRYPAWAKRVECSYVPLALMSELNPPFVPRPWWGFGVLYPQAPAGNEWIINHYLLLKYGTAILGPEFKELAPSIGIRQVQEASARDLLAEWVPKTNDFPWLSDSHQQSYLVLNLCRILRTCIGGEPGSKKVAGAWAKARYPEWKELIEEAERWTYGREMKRQDATVAFVRFAVEKVREAGFLIEAVRDAPTRP